MTDIRIEIQNPAGKGLNDVAKSDLLDKEELSYCLNYEILKEGELTKRTEPIEYDTNLTSLLGTLFDSVLNMSDPYYPPAKPTDMYNDFILLFFGEKGGAYKLYAVYQTNATTWTSTEIAITSVTYDSGTSIEFVVGEMRVLILDQNKDSDNPACYYKVDEYGEQKYGIMGIPAPKSKPAITQLTKWDESDWETSADNAKVSEPGLVQVIYTVSTKEGEESNPSPISDTLDMQFFEYDSEGKETRWINKIKISNLSLPTVPDDIKNDLKYFNIYYRVFRYSEGDIYKNFEFAQQFEIIDKENQDKTTTGNNYAIVVETEPGNNANYENDIAPVAKTGAEIGGVTFLGNIRHKIKFPFNFYYYCPIALNNINSKSYIDAVVRIKLDESDIDNLEWDYYDNDSDNYIDSDKVDKIRIYDSDLTTPLNVLYVLNKASNYCIVYVKIPCLEAGNGHTIYLCFNNATNYKDGVDNSEYQTYNYGKWIPDEHWADYASYVFNGERVKNENSIICSRADFEVNFYNQYDDTHYHNEKLINKADVKKSGWLVTDNIFYLAKIGHIPLLNKSIGAYAIKSGDDSGVDYRRNLANIKMTAEPLKKFTVWGKFRFATANLITTNTYNIFYIYAEGGAANYLMLYLVYDNGKWYFKIENGNADHLFSIEIDDGDAWETFSIVLSVDIENNKFSLYLYNVNYGYCYEYDDDIAFNDIKDNPILIISYYSFNLQAADSYIDQFQFIKDLYLDASDSDNINTALNILNFMPAFDEIIGYKINDDTENNNITFGETQSAIYKDQFNMLKWSNLNGLTFPDLNYKRVKEPILRVISAPSFLKLQYANTLIVFTRNQIFRFVLSGSPEEWQAKTEILNEQYAQYGLLAPKSLVKAGDKLYWLSEMGIIMWDEAGFHLISHDRIDIEISENVIGFFCPLRHQVIFSTQSTQTIMTG